MRRTTTGRHLMVTADYPPRSGGQARYLADLWGGLAPDRATVLAPAAEGSRAESGPEIVRVPLPLDGTLSARLSRTMSLCRHAVRWARRRKVVAVHAGQVIASGTAALACRRLLGLPYSVVVHGSDLLEFARHPLAGPLARRILAGASRVVVNSRYTADQAAIHGAAQNRLRIVHPSVEPARFASARGGETVRARYGLEDRTILLTVGRLVKRKGQDTVIRAIPHLTGQHPDLHYLVVGDGPDRARLEALSRECGVSDRVTFATSVSDDDLPAYYAASDVFVMVSREIREQGDVEGFGIVYLEAGAAARPVVAGRSGGVCDAVEDGVSGLLVTPGDSAAVVGTLRGLLKDPALRTRLGEQGRRRVRESFTTERGRRTLEEVIDEFAAA